MIDYALRELLHIDHDDTDVTSRINGFEGKVAIIKSVTKRSTTLRGEPARLIADTLGEISVLKTYRDAVAHAHIHAPDAEMVQTSIKHGKPYEVDISTTTLKALFDRIVGFQMEMVDALRVMQHHFDEFDLETNDYSDPSEVTNGQPFQAHFLQLQSRSNRKSLPSIPQLAEEPPSQQEMGES
jgi:hypothetical protein